MTTTTGSRAVQIDNRLSDLFQTRRRDAENGTEQREPDFPVASPETWSWLDQFKAVTEQQEEDAKLEEINARSTFKVRKEECRPFWAPEDSKKTEAIWKMSKPVLAKDCMKQRKASLRKTGKR